LHATARNGTQQHYGRHSLDVTRWCWWRLGRAAALGISLSRLSHSPKLATAARSWALFRGVFSGLAGEQHPGTWAGAIRLGSGVPAGPDVARLRTAKPGSMRRAPRRQLPVHGGHGGTPANSAKRAWRFPLNHARRLVGWQQTTRCSHEFSNQDQGIEHNLRAEGVSWGVETRAPSPAAARPEHQPCCLPRGDGRHHALRRASAEQGRRGPLGQCSWLTSLPRLHHACVNSLTQAY
jgi:hypothetical protein